MRLLGEGDLDRPRRRRAVERHRRPPGIARVARGHDPRREAHVAHLAAHGALDRHQLRQHAALDGLRRVVGGDAAVGGLHGGKRRRRRPGSAASRRCRCRGGSGRSPPPPPRWRRPTSRRGSPRVPGVQGAAVQRIVGRRAHRQLGRVGAPDDDRAGVQKVLDQRRVIGRDDALERGHAVGGRRALDVDVLLDGHRDAVQRPELGTVGQRAVRAIRGGEGLVAVVVDDRVELGIERADAADDRFHHVDAAEPLLPDALCQLTGAKAPQRIAHDSLRSGKMSTQRPASAER